MNSNSLHFQAAAIEEAAEVFLVNESSSKVVHCFHIKPLLSLEYRCSVNGHSCQPFCFISEAKEYRVILP